MSEHGSDEPARRAFGGWGASTRSVGYEHRPADAAEISSILRAAATRGAIARGLGRSYGDQAACAGGAVVAMERFGQCGPIGSDGRVRVGAGVSIQQLLELSIPEGWFVPVTPGTRQVTIGGAIAADVHGKNHHVHGTFCAHVEELTLVTASGEPLSCSPTVRPEVFWATAGGMGLTGIITEAVIVMTPIETSTVLVDTTRLHGVDDVLDAMRVDDPSMPYSVAWIDLHGRRPCRSILTTGRFARNHEVTDRTARRAPSGRTVVVPGALPGGLLRRSTVAALNEAWFRLAPRARVQEPQTIGRFFHPLDGIADWNRIYGPRGLVQWQIVVPTGAEQTLHSCIARLSMARIPCFLTVLKRFGPANRGPMSFPIDGWTLSTDMPAATTGLGEILDRLDHEVVEAGGRVYLAKDGRLDPRLVPRMYPRIDEWRAVRAELDPDRIMVSDLARRLGL